MLDISIIAAAQKYPFLIGEAPQLCTRLEQLIAKGAWASWQELEEVMAELRRPPHTHTYLVDIALEHTLTPIRILHLSQEGWHVVRRERTAAFIGACYRDRKEVMIAEGLCGFKRDVTFFHELTHAYFGEAFYDCTTSLDIGARRSANIKSMIVEWAARRARMRPDSLRCAVQTFHLEPEIYDGASYEAFYNFERQIVFPFNGADSYEKYRDLSPQME